MGWTRGFAWSGRVTKRREYRVSCLTSFRFSNERLEHFCVLVWLWEVDIIPRAKAPAPVRLMIPSRWNVIGDGMVQGERAEIV